MFLKLQLNTMKNGGGFGTDGKAPRNSVLKYQGLNTLSNFDQVQ